MIEQQRRRRTGTGGRGQGEDLGSQPWEPRGENVPGRGVSVRKSPRGRKPGERVQTTNV